MGAIAPRKGLFIMAFGCCLFVTNYLHNIVSASDFRGTDYLQYAGDRIPLNESGMIDSKTVPKPKATMVHSDPYFMGGFRNQHMRFVSFVACAVHNNISQILLPSLRWLNSLNQPHSIQHELLFDVRYWNSRAESVGLPTLVNYDANVLEGIIPINGSSEIQDVIPCWNLSTSLYSGLDGPHLRSKAINLRKTSIFGLIGQGGRYSHCRRSHILGFEEENSLYTIKEAARQEKDPSNKVYRFTHLIAHGGSMPLWYDYGRLQNGREKAKESVLINDELVEVHPDHVPVEKAMYKLMRPSKYLREAAENSMNTAMKSTTKTYGIQTPPRLLALHPRVEQDMLSHKCAMFMEPNLTKIVERIQTSSSFHEANSSGYIFDLAFIAIAKEGVEKGASRGGQLGMIMDQNRDALHCARQFGLFGSSSKMGIPIFESGSDSAAGIKFPRASAGSNASEVQVFDTAESLGVKELVASIIDFFTAVNADIFVGVRGSTFSTDAFSVRYYEHKEEGGGENYIVNRKGIQRLYGPASPHTCKKSKATN